MSQSTVSTESLMRRFESFNKGKSYGKTIKPLNFFLIGFSNDKNVKPIAPFSKDTQSMPHGVFINYRNGKIMKGQQYFKTLADELWNYMHHPESKLEGTRGTLRRRHLRVNNIYYWQSIKKL